MSRPTSLGDLVIKAVCRASALDYAIVEGDSTIFVWSANAAEQIEAALAEEWPQVQKAIRRMEKMQAQKIVLANPK